jgi:hypothetical protein
VSQATFDVVHVNAEFADQASDHDPGIVRLDLGAAAVPALPPPALLALAIALFAVGLAVTRRRRADR